VLVNASGRTSGRATSHAQVDRERHRAGDGDRRSTNAVLHYLAIASAAGVKWTSRTSSACAGRSGAVHLKPSGRYVAVDFHAAGGVPQVLKMLLVHGLLHGECMTITAARSPGNWLPCPGAAQGPGRHPSLGQADVFAGAPRGPERQPRDRGLRREDHRTEADLDHRPARVFDSESAAMNAILARDQSGRRHRDPLRGAEGRPACRNARADLGAHRPGLGDSVGLITDGRFSGATWGMVVGHVAPKLRRRHDRAGEGEGLDHHRREETAAAAQRLRERARRAKEEWKQPKPRYTRGLMAKYMKLFRLRAGSITDGAD